MAEEVLSALHDLLSAAVNGKLDEFDVDLETDKLKGENFLGDIIFVRLNHKKTQKAYQLVIKKAIDFGRLTYLDTIYDTEINFYEQVWPTLLKFQETASVHFDKIPKCYATCQTRGQEKLALEDLHFQDFVLFDKTKTFEHQHFEYIFKCYGKFHAISYAFREQYAEEFSRLESLTNKKGFEATDEQSAKVTKLFIQSIEEKRTLLNANDENLLDTFDELMVVMKNDGYKKVVNYNCDTKVLLHGDCWSNNMMFKYDKNGRVIDMRFLDFQLVNCGSPVKDLSYCFYASASQESLEKLDDLLTIYLTTFNETLEKFHVHSQNFYTLAKLKMEWKTLALFGVFLSMYLLTIKFVNKNYTPEITKVALPPIAEEHMDTYHERTKSLISHICKNKYFKQL